MKYDYVIVGGGLAGSILAYTLLKYDQHVLLIDNNHSKSSSVIAAGIFNPVTGKRMTKTWKADLIFPFLHSFYSNIEAESNSKFLYQNKVYKPFDSITEQNFWFAQSSEKEYEGYVEVGFKKAELESFLKTNLGGISINHSGFVDVNNFLAHIKSQLVDKHQYREGKVLPNNIEYLAERCLIKFENEQIETGKIIFCEGHQAIDNQLWSWLPWQLTKGEILEMEIHGMKSDYIINKSVFICPVPGSTKYKIGSTYNWEDISENITQEGKIELVDKLESFFNIKHTITAHFAGIRPTVLHRMPFIGTHPQYPNYLIFNGFGSKAVSLAPYFANQFARYLVRDDKLDEEVNINRFYPLYSSDD